MIYGVVYVWQAHFSIGDWKGISKAPVIIIIKSEVNIFPTVIFSLVVYLRCLLHHILSLIAYTSEKTGNLFSLLLCSSSWVQIVGYVLVCRSYSFVCTVHNLIIIFAQKYLEPLNLYKMPVRYILWSVWIRLSLFSQVSIIRYVGAVCFQFTHFPLWWLREYIYELWCGQARDWRTHTQTDRIRQWQYPKAVTGLL